MRYLNRFLVSGSILLIKIYRTTLSPVVGHNCRFEPTCSQYAEQALEKYGFIRGAGLAIWRILRCNPFIKGGYDPVR